MDSWFKCNKLSLNVSKTNFILFKSSKKIKYADHCQIKINGQEIKRVHSTKFPGVLIDDSLNFKGHIDHFIHKLSKYVGLFYKIRHILPLSALLTLYKTLFEPHLNYCNVIWCNTLPSQLKKTYIPAKESHMGSVLVRDKYPHPPSTAYMKQDWWWPQGVALYLQLQKTTKKITSYQAISNIELFLHGLLGCMFMIVCICHVIIMYVLVRFCVHLLIIFAYRW